MGDHRRVAGRLVGVDARRERLDQRVVVGLVEEHEADQLLGRLRCAGGGSTRCWFEHHRSLVQRRIRSPVLISRLPSTYGASIHVAVLVPHLQAARARLAVEDRQRAEVGVRPDAELVGLRVVVAARPVPVERHLRRRRPALVAERRLGQTEGERTQVEQFVGERPAGPPPRLGRRLEAGRFGGPAVRGERHRAASAPPRSGTSTRPERERLLEVGRRVDPVGRGVRLPARARPTRDRPAPSTAIAALLSGGRWKNARHCRGSRRSPSLSGCGG